MLLCDALATLDGIQLPEGLLLKDVSEVVLAACRC